MLYLQYFYNILLLPPLILSSSFTFTIYLSLFLS